MKKFFEDFKAFAMRGNVIDMAVGVIIGAACGVPAGRHGARHGGCADPPPGGLGARAAADG